ncbi:MAG: cell wall-binding repeat-containing protein, partial [Actinomycetia bacterium]|nr:cell wall-binding repeat-containing protein [Actinomycetes bacterium]
PGRFETAAAVSTRFFAPGAADAFVATGYGYPDALAGSAAAATEGAPVLLVAPGAVPAATAAELTRLRPARITVLGGTGVVSSAVASALAGYAPTVRRLAGADRYATAAAISAAEFPTAPRALLATGSGFADALAGGPAAARAAGPVLLSQPACVPTSTGVELARLRAGQVTLLGGTGSLSAAVAALVPCEVYTPYVARVPLPVGCHTVGPDSAGVKVYLVQRELGLTSHRERYDAATVAAVRAFQSSRGLPVTGLVDRATWDALGTGYDFCIDRYVVQPTVAPTAPASAHVAAMLAQANSLLGKRYIWGGAGPIGYDCSGLALQSMYAGGRLVPGVTIDRHVTASFATARAIYTSTALPHLPLSQRRPGDLVFWYDDVSHMAVYLGNDRIVEAVRPSVRTASLWVHGTPLPTVVRPFP